MSLIVFSTYYKVSRLHPSSYKCDYL